MKTFGIIAEGPTDQIVIQNILIGYFNIDVSSHVKFLQPLLDETDKGQKDTLGGGWNNVFEYCRSYRFVEAFEQNDYIIIQIDSDVCEDINFGVKKTHANGSMKTEVQLIESIIDKFVSEVIAAFGELKYEQIKDRIIFAICINEIECWLLPIYYTDKIRSATNNCIYRLNEKIRDEFNCYINKDDKNNMEKIYFKISKPYLKHKILVNRYEDNISLKYFIESLDSLNISLTSN